MRLYAILRYLCSIAAAINGSLACPGGSSARMEAGNGTFGCRQQEAAVVRAWRACSGPVPGLFLVLFAVAGERQFGKAPAGTAKARKYAKARNGQKGQRLAPSVSPLAAVPLAACSSSQGAGHGGRAPAGDRQVFALWLGGLFPTCSGPVPDLLASACYKREQVQSSAKAALTPCPPSQRLGEGV